MNKIKSFVIAASAVLLFTTSANACLAACKEKKRDEAYSKQLSAATLQTIVDNALPQKAVDPELGEPYQVYPIDVKPFQDDSFVPWKQLQGALQPFYVMSGYFQIGLELVPLSDIGNEHLVPDGGTAGDRGSVRHSGSDSAVSHLQGSDRFGDCRQRGSPSVQRLEIRDNVLLIIHFHASSILI